tara:strand:+ start:2123 stop:2950 length:828 start_codon:yes stop_codon:yes gene_type:complete
MSEFLNEEAKQHLMKSNILKDDFGWEVPIESVPLPSRGEIYTPDSALYNRETVNIKAMTANEEDILASPALLKDGTAIMHLLRSCIVEKNIDVEDMIAGDRNALMVSIRITGYGSRYEVKSTCEECGASNDVTIDLSSLEIKRLKIKPTEPGKNEFSFVLPVTKKNVIFKFLTPKDEKDRKAKREFMKKHTAGLIDKSVTSFLEACIVSIDGITDKNKIKHFILYMPALDSKSLRDFMSNNEPGIDMTNKYVCSNCGHENNINLPINSNFFWPRT